ncbi:gliding motility-associated C-terminal domain-containing protein [Xanthomarina sp. F1114]|uniref:gliding motility-associated C-terminal domain-containing protein n=1 Tax=Xanthomarina sp. F1114 TaxID=2996019 RepID=UPI00225E2CA0|nr:gliding motility-associated C-terminal domain-containing protein [Xanthomarina sp. F1114]MCX7547649.1 gliding motility-associated C-terminal domain-containing protein [Xanthomarina sp. F1114]
MTNPKIFFVVFVYALLGNILFSYAQCPTISDSTQSFCDLDSILVSDLQAIDNGGGIVWYDTATSVTPLSGSTSLINNEDYFADDNSGSCGSRERVVVNIVGPPAGLNFQGVCVEDPSDATISDLIVFGHDVQWYLTPTGGTVLNPSSILIDNTIYYADQSILGSGCRTSRLSVYVNVGIVPSPTGNALQRFCVITGSIPPTVADLDPNGNTIHWYSSASSATPLDPDIPLINGQSYFATTLDPPCESSSRLEVTVELVNQSSPGSDSTLDLCEGDTNSYNLFNSLGGTPEAGGFWSPALNSGTGVFDPTVDSPGTYTYTIPSPDPICSDASASVTVSFFVSPDAGTNGSLEICEGDTNTYELFNSLGGTPETGGSWSPALNSGTDLFDPAIDPPGIYTYTIPSSNPACNDASASVTVSFILLPDAGTDGSLEICEDDINTFDLFNSLGGTPETGGSWSPALNSGTGVFDPTIDSPGTYTYTVSSPNPACNDASATVTVSLIVPPDAGINGNLEICEDDTNTYDLFDSLGGTPEAGGSWSPALNSGTGVFDPAIDSPGTYTYTISSSNPACNDASASVIVDFIPTPDAGTNGNLDICENDTSTYDLFNILGGTPETGGSWSPTLNSGTGVFDPTVDSAGTYTYTIPSIDPACNDASATVIVSFIIPPDAGANGNLEICDNDTNIFDLFDSLGGTPETGGSWTPTLNSGTGIFDPTIDSPGTYTYTITSSNPACNDASASVIVDFIPTPDAGTNGNLEICEADVNSYDLFNMLGGTPETGGSWSPALDSGTGVFNPTVDSAGTYTYTIVSSNPICSDSSASVTVSFILPPDAGTNGILEICENDTNTYNLLNSLGGTPDSNGTWSPVLNSGSGIFNPNIDLPGIYTYTVNQPECGLTDSSQVTISISELPDLTSLELTLNNICEGEELLVSIINASSLIDGNYLITYNVSGVDNFVNSVLVEIIDGEGNFIISAIALTIPGEYNLTITGFISESTNCGGDTSLVIPLEFEVYESITPVLIDEGNIFCETDEPTIEDLSDNISNSNNITWYDTNGNIITSSTSLIDGTTYYGSIMSIQNCPTLNELAVTVQLIVCEEDMIIPDGFSPNGDTINDTFHINGLNELYPNFKLTIYNRYGNKLYRGDINTPEWDGTSNTDSSFGNSTVPVGVYFYILEFNDGNREPIQGRLYLNM